MPLLSVPLCLGGEPIDALWQSLQHGVTIKLHPGRPDELAGSMAASGHLLLAIVLSLGLELTGDFCRQYICQTCLASACYTSAHNNVGMFCNSRGIGSRVVDRIQAEITLNFTLEAPKLGFGCGGRSVCLLFPRVPNFFNSRPERPV